MKLDRSAYIKFITLHRFVDMVA